MSVIVVVNRGTDSVCNLADKNEITDSVAGAELPVELGYVIAVAVPTALYFISALSSHGLKPMVTGSAVPLALEVS